MFASIAEFERDFMIEHTRAGLAATRARGVVVADLANGTNILIMRLFMLEPGCDIQAICE